MEKFKLLWISIRPRQWSKNLFIFVPIIFSRKFFQASCLTKILLVAFLFTLLSGAVYLINDVFNLKEDKLHPEKRKRPLPSGRLKKREAVSFATLLVLISISTVFILHFPTGVIFLSYFLLQILYSYRLREEAILDVFCIATGFILRIYSGALIINVPVSPWLLSFMTFLSLFLGFSKRWQEYTILSQNNSLLSRKSLLIYSSPMLNNFLAITASGTILTYTFYTFSSPTAHETGGGLKFTLPFVIFGIFRYLFLIEKKPGWGVEEVIGKDSIFLINLFLYLISILLALYSGERF